MTTQQETLALAGYLERALELLEYGWTFDELRSELKAMERGTEICPECGTEFTSKRSDSITCSGRCRTARHRRLAKATP